MDVFSVRLKTALDSRKMKQADLAREADVDKGAINHYLAGTYVPKYDVLKRLAKALNVSETWLLGDDEPMEKNTEEYYSYIKAQAQDAVRELLAVAKLRRGDIFVVGCSSSEVVGERIGKGSSAEAARAIYEGIAPVLAEEGIYLAAQCCEHLNRALIIERACAEAYGLEIVCVKPQPHAGGSFATTVYENATDPVAVEHIRAHAGLDIGGTLIGMHLRDVAVPVRLSLCRIGEAGLLCARTRPKFIGGMRAHYPDGETR